MFGAFASQDDFSALVYGESNPTTMNFIRQRFEQSQSMLNDAGMAFAQQARNIFEYFNGDEAIRRARAALRSASNFFKNNDVHYLDTIGDLQSAQTVMQRWIMACPEIRKMFHEQRLDGYSDSYLDVSPNSIGEDHLDYRMVRHGMVDILETAQDDEPDWKVKFYFEEGLISNEDRPLTFDEKCVVADSWERARSFLLTGDDPTSPFGNKL